MNPPPNPSSSSSSSPAPPSSQSLSLSHPQSKSQSRLTSLSSSLKYLFSPSSSSLKYLFSPSSSSTNSQQRPTSLRVRASLRTLRYISIFLFWRLVRYAKYAAVGALVAAVSGTVIGSVVSGAAFVLAPTGIIGGAGAGLIWAVARFGWRRAKGRMRRGGGSGADARRDERGDAGVTTTEGERGMRRGTMGGGRVEPW